MAATDPLLALVTRVPPDRLLVATDFDGTLSPIVQHPEAARPLDGAAEVLERLGASVRRVAVITGRSAAALRRLLPADGVLVLGDYGRPAPTELEADALTRFNIEATELLRRRPGLRVEAKPGSTSVHYRDRPEAGVGLVEELRPVAARFGLEVRSGRMVAEVVPAGWDKARALEALIKEERAAGAVYAGDDEGDRGCFEFLARSSLPHLAIGVRSPEAAPDLFAACDVVVDSPEGALALLTRLADAIQSHRGPGRAGRGPASSATG